MKILVNAAAVLALAIQCGAPQAAPVAFAVREARVSTMYAVSGILRSKSDGSVIKLVQGLAYGATREDAVDAFATDVLVKYPAYALIDTVASSLTVSHPGCGNRI
jgi:hypothetical protein